MYFFLKKRESGLLNTLGPTRAADEVAGLVAEERGGEQDQAEHPDVDVERVLRDERAGGEQQRVAGQDREQQAGLDEDDERDADERRGPERLDQVVGVEEVGPEGRDRSGGREGGRHQHVPRVRAPSVGGPWPGCADRVRRRAEQWRRAGHREGCRCPGGVSPKTVSNVIHGVVFVRPETRERVERALAELDYVPNLGARGLRNGRYGLIALALPDLSTAYSAELAHHFVEEAHARGWSLQIEETAAEPGRERDLLSRARSHLVDGLVLNPVSLADSAVPGGPRAAAADGAHRRGRPGPGRPRGRGQRAGLAGHDGAPAGDGPAAHRRGGHAPGGVETAAARQRTEGYRAALAAAGVAHDPDLEIPVRHWTTEQAVDADPRPPGAARGARRVRLLHGLDGARGAERAVGARAAGARTTSRSRGSTTSPPPGTRSLR